MGSPQLSDSFRRSYESFESYPRNLVHQTSYLGVIKAYRSRLDIAAPKLLTADDAEVYVPFRDLLPNNQGKFFSRLAHDLSANLRSISEKEGSRRLRAEGLAWRPIDP
jgi:hypothetical protein